MDEEMEYAEMLEIPVSTVNVTKKRGRKPKKPQDLKEKVITKVNDGAGESTPAAKPKQKRAVAKTADESTQAETNADVNITDERTLLSAQEITQPQNPAPNQSETNPDGLELALQEAQESEVVAESLPVSIPRRRKRPFFARLFGKKENAWEYESEEEQASASSIPPSDPDEPLPIYNYDLWDKATPTDQERKEKRYSLIAGLEFAACFALCLGIFLTNVFMPNSAINTFFRSLGKTEQIDARTYADFTLSSVFMEEDAELTLSETGILSFQEVGCVYPAADGVISELSQNADGTWTLKITHSPAFSEIISGLSYASCSVGSTVKSNVPIGYSDGNAVVQVSMYDSGELLNCFHLTENGGLAWTEE